ncbi:ester cyclase [Undibacterium terreum]|uniref:Ester cyclase n=1 Tax=Undibacterium terreum TaxID=1224302 RepID=A0A916XCL7_9BURK|nr:ester cyclase [Undibacterium terreum]GGC61896.1 hypothetical protein GCM10011396_06000 [Undibacterium terreum]
MFKHTTKGLGTTFTTSAARLSSALAISTAAATLALSGLPAHAAESGDSSLPQPLHLSVSAASEDSASIILAARRYAAFWNSGEAQYAQQALAADFKDRTLPAGRPQGVAGPLQASAGFRAAVPDLTATMEDVVVAGDRVSVHLHFKGHFTGQFGQTRGQGQVIDFQAFDLYRVADGKIAENWHLEDNLTLLKQMGVIAQ